MPVHTVQCLCTTAFRVANKKKNECFVSQDIFRFCPCTRVTRLPIKRAKRDLKRDTRVKLREVFTFRPVSMFAQF